MRFQYNLITIVLCCSLLYSCGNGTDSQTEALPVEQTLKGTVLEFGNETELLNMKQMKVVNEQFLLVVDEKEEGIFQVFSVPDNKFLYEWGKKGRGPDEFIDYGFNSIVGTNKNKVSIFKPTYAMVSSYAVTNESLVHKGDFSLSYENQPDLLNGLKRVDDSLFVVRNSSITEKNKEFVALEPGNKKPLFLFGQFPEEGSDMAPLMKAQEYWALLAPRPDGTKMAVFYIYHNTFKILGKDGSLEKAIEVYDSNLASLDSDSRMLLRSIVETTDDYIYVFAPNATRAEMKDSEDFRPTVEIWDWEGNPVHRFKLDRPVHAFAVSEKYGKFYSYYIYKKNKIYDLIP